MEFPGSSVKKRWVRVPSYLVQNIKIYKGSTCRVHRSWHKIRGFQVHILEKLTTNLKEKCKGPRKRFKLVWGKIERSYPDMLYTHSKLNKNRNSHTHQSPVVCTDASTPLTPCRVTSPVVPPINSSHCQNPASTCISKFSMSIWSCVIYFDNTI